MSRQTSFEIRPTVAVDADGIATSQTPAAGGVQSLTLDGALTSGGVYTADIPRRIDITSAADETARTFTITGTNRYGDAITEALAGANIGIATSLNDFATVTAITVDDDTTGAVTSGNSLVITGPWQPADNFREDPHIGVVGTQVGTVNWGVELTLSPINAARAFPYQNPPVVDATDFNVLDHATLVGETASGGSIIETPITAWRGKINSYTQATGVGVLFEAVNAGAYA